MENIKSSEIEKIIEIMKDNELTELTVEDKEISLYIKGNGYKKETEEPQVVEPEPVINVTPKEEKKETVPIISNMIGMFYSRLTPAHEPLVKVGDIVTAGQDVCVIETIKLVNKIKSDVTGRITEICIEDGNPVEYGQVIMYVEKI